MILSQFISSPSRNRTIITYDDGEQERYGLFTEEEKPNENNEVRLKQIITEELQNILAEVDPTKVLDPVEMAKKRQADRETRSERIRKRAEHLERARRLMGILYPLTYRDEMVFTIKQNNDEGALTNSLFGFMFQPRPQWTSQIHF